MTGRAATSPTTQTPQGTWNCGGWWPRNWPANAEINRNLREWTASKTKEWLYHEGQAHGVPFAPFYTPKEVFESPHQRERDFFVSVDHPEAGKYDYAGPSFRMTETPPVMDRAPLLGEHNCEVLRDLGCTGEEIVALARSGVI